MSGIWVLSGITLVHLLLTFIIIRRLNNNHKMQEQQHHIFIHFVDDFRIKSDNNKLDKILEILSLNNLKLKKMAQDLTALTAEVEKNGQVDQSAIVLLNGLKTKLDEAIASNDPAAIQALSDALGASSQALADAVIANTPAA